MAKELIDLFDGNEVERLINLCLSGDHYPLLDQAHEFALRKYYGGSAREFNADIAAGALIELDRVTEERNQYLNALKVDFVALQEISGMTDLGGEVDERPDVVMAVKRLSDSEDALKRCVYLLVTGSHPGLKFEVDHEHRMAWPVNDPSKE